MSQSTATDTVDSEDNSEDPDPELPDTSATKFLLENMSPQTEVKALKQAATTPGFTPVCKKMGQMNIRTGSERLLTDDSVNISELCKKLVKFMMADDNSFCCPDKGKEKIRFCRDTLEVLHKKFMCEDNVKCSDQSFAKYVPDMIKIPKPEPGLLSTMQTNIMKKSLASTW